MITHDEAIDLAADRVDFDLSRAETLELESHLAWCRSCAGAAQAFAEDDGVLDHFTWPDEGGQGRSDDEWSPRDEGGEGDDADDDSPPREPGQEPDRPPTGADGRDDDDDGDSGRLSASERDPAGADEAPAPWRTSDEDDDVAPVTPEERAASEAAKQEFLDELRRIAEEMAAAMSDDELADVDSEAREADGALPDCVAHGVEDAAGEHGAPTGKSVHKAAEEAVRDADGLESTDYGTVAVYRTIQGFRHARNGNPTPEASAAAAAAIRNAVLRSRTGSSGVDRHRAHGRLDSRGLHRIAEGDHRLFKRNNAPDPGKYLVWLMVDVSASMAGSDVAEAAAVARALADGTRGTPTVRMAVWAWSSPFLQRGRAIAGVAKVWETGQPTSHVFRLTELSMGGTPDSPVLDWAQKAIRRVVSSDERPVIIMCSDGQGYGNLGRVIEEANRRGVAVKSVAMGWGIREAEQLARYGRGNFISWMGGIEATARPLATMIARMAAGK